MKEGQLATAALKNFLESQCYNKAEVARKANIDPEKFYAMLTNKRIMTADNLISVCGVLNVRDILKLVD